MNKVVEDLAQRIGVEPEAAALLAQGRVMAAPVGAVLFRPGDACPAYVLVDKGAIAVKGVCEDGREILYYRVRPGQTCFQTTLCLLTDGHYTAEGVVEEALEALMLPADTFDALLAASKAFRRYAFIGFADRLKGLTGQVNELAFAPLAARLANALLARPGGEIAATHEALARELGAAREAVSRILGDWERKGLVRLGRGRILVLDRAGLAAKARD